MRAKAWYEKIASASPSLIEIEIEGESIESLRELACEYEVEDNLIKIYYYDDEGNTIHQDYFPF